MVYILEKSFLGYLKSYIIGEHNRHLYLCRWTHKHTHIHTYLCSVNYVFRFLASIVERVVLLGAPISIDTSRWKAARKVRTHILYPESGFHLLCRKHTSVHFLWCNMYSTDCLTVKQNFHFKHHCYHCY